MGLSNDLISQFVKATKDTNERKTESTRYGTVKEHEGTTYVQLDGSELLTPVSTTTTIKDGDRVTVLIKDHAALVTGNISDPSASGITVKEIGDQITEFEIIIADKVSVQELEAERGRIDNLISDNVHIKDTLTANNAYIENLIAADVEITGRLSATEADIGELTTNKLDATTANITFATIDNLEATNAVIYNLQGTYADFAELTTGNFEAVNGYIKNLETNKLDAETAEIKYANIDFSNISKATMEEFYAKSGLIENVVVGDGYITGNLVGVTIKGDLIEAGTLVAEKLVIRGTDGLYYKLNTNGETVSSQQTEYNSLHGSIITAKSVTAEKVNVKDLVAFGATIGGFHISDSALYSGVKESITNTTQGVYLDKDGQFYVGDSNNFFKYYKGTDGNYKLEIAAQSIKMSTKNQTVESAVSSLQTNVNGAVKATYRYFLLQDDALAAPSKPTTYPPSSAWTTTEPAYDSDATDSLYFVDCTVYCDNSFKYSSVALSSSYMNSSEVQGKLNDTTDGFNKALTDQTLDILDTCEGMIADAGAQYIKQGDFDDYKTSVESKFTNEGNTIEARFRVVTDLVDERDESLSARIKDIENYIRIDPETGSITFGSSENSITLTLEHDQIAFKKNGVAFGTWDGNDFYTNNIIVKLAEDQSSTGNERAQFGNFAFIPRSDGSLQFLKIGG